MVHKCVDPALKPQSQFKSKQTLLKPIPITPGRKAANPAVGWTLLRLPSVIKIEKLFPLQAKQPLEVC